ncbi:MAG: type III-A CRISPR-associated RAMP protein Csm4 [Anaerolineae bacterium]|nr:type III-A CRISPR-associated RAMP protein Csm4 [Anaerolineae bacterium]
MQAMAYALRPRAPFHFGVRGVGVEATAMTARSDSLFSALCITLRELYGEAELTGFLERFPTREHPDRDPPLLLSAGLPYAGDVRFYPRPLLPTPGLEHDPAEQKYQKKINLVSETIFRAWISGDDVLPYYDRPQRQNLLHGGRVWVTTDERTTLSRSDDFVDEDTGQVRMWTVGDVSRVTVDRASSASSVYQAGQVRFAPGAGLYLLAAWRDDEWRDRFWKVLQVLGDAGIGGERSSGYGLFTPLEPASVALPDAEGAERWATLSSCWPLPGQEGILGRGAAYQLENRRGWMDSPEGRNLRRKSVRMLEPGSVLRALPDQTIYGGLADVTPDVFTAHTVWRYGLALPVGYGRAMGGEGDG